MWLRTDRGRISPEQWPYQIATIEDVAPVATRFPGLKTILDVQSSNRVLASTRGLTGIAPCFVTVYLDGLDVPREDIELVRTWDLAAVEFYTADQVPARYRTKSYACGVVLLWSKWY